MVVRMAKRHFFLVSSFQLHAPPQVLEHADRIAWTSSTRMNASASATTTGVPKVK
jgi:hypothetical protein